MSKNAKTQPQAKAPIKINMSQMANATLVELGTMDTSNNDDAAHYFIVNAKERIGTPYIGYLFYEDKSRRTVYGNTVKQVHAGLREKYKLLAESVSTSKTVKDALRRTLSAVAESL